jgi:prepilin-type N-terminal cleavage/methylation domain-containing protein/prepilin-type processing-associated H-X9-DG protein
VHVRKAFTLVELLVVMVVIAILASLILSGYQNVTAAAQGALCANNLRQIGAAIQAYSNDHNGEMPPGPERHYPSPTNPGVANSSYLTDTLTTAPNNYLGFRSTYQDIMKSGHATLHNAGVFWCPTDNYMATHSSVNYFGGSYAFSYYVGSDPGFPTYYDITSQSWVPWPNTDPNHSYHPEYGKVSAMRNASKIIYMIDGAPPSIYVNMIIDPGGRDWPFVANATSDPTPQLNAGYGEVLFRHSNKANALFMDGSVRALSYSDLAHTGTLYTKPQPL